MTIDRAYNMIITDREFGGSKHAYALLGFEVSSQTWNLLGGRKDPSDKTRGVTAARELYEESAMMLDKRGDPPYWGKLPFYEFESHKVFIHGNTLPVRVSKLNEAAGRALNSPLPHCYKEMSKYQLVKLTDLVNLAISRNNIYVHPKEGPMKINGYVLRTLNKSNRTALGPFMY